MASHAHCHKHAKRQVFSLILCLNVLPACTPHMCPAPSEIESLELELLLEVASYCVGTRNRTQVLHKSQTCSLPLTMLLAQQVGLDEGDIFTVAAAGEKS